MPTQVQIRTSAGVWQPTIATGSPSGVHVYRTGAWKPVLACYTYKSGRWRLVFDLGQAMPPVTLHGFNLANSTSAQMTWNAPLAVDGGPAKSFYVERKEGTWAAGKFAQKAGTATVKSSDLPGTTLNYTWPGLGQDTTYQFQVFWRNSVGTLATGSNTIVCSTGHASYTEQNPDWPSSTQYNLTAHRSNSWNGRGGWGGPYGDWNTVTQGSPNSPDADHSSFGCVDYSDLSEQVSAKVHTAQYGSQAEINTAGDKVARNCQVTRAAIRQVYRTNDGGAGGGIPVRIARGGADFTKDREPVDGTVHLRFNAPDTGSAKGDVNGFVLTDADGSPDNDNTFEGWMQHIIRRDDTRLDTLIIHTQDGSGNANIGYNRFCNFREVADGTPNWRVILNLKWSVQTITAVAPVWNKQD